VKHPVRERVRRVQRHYNDEHPSPLLPRQRRPLERAHQRRRARHPARRPHAARVCGIHRASIDTPIDAPIDRCTDRSLFLSNLASSVDRFSRLDRSVGRARARRLAIDVAIASNLAPRLDKNSDRRVDRRANEWLRFARSLSDRDARRDAAHRDVDARRERRRARRAWER